MNKCLDHWELNRRRTTMTSFRQQMTPRDTTLQIQFICQWHRLLLSPLNLSKIALSTWSLLAKTSSLLLTKVNDLGTKKQLTRDLKWYDKSQTSTLTISHESPANVEQQR